MPFNPQQHHRTSIRIPGAEYGLGCYFVTICCTQKSLLFGEIVHRVCQLNRLGKIAEACLVAIPEHLPHVCIDAYIVMPNHIHAIFRLREPATTVPETRHFGTSAGGTLSTVVGTYKAAGTRQANREMGKQYKLWQRNYYEHIIRSADAYERIKAYITENPERWAEDAENPNRVNRG